MSDLFTLLPTNIPTYLVIVLILSYLIWVKFGSNKGKLAPSNSKELDSLLNIFLYTLISVLVFALAINILMTYNMSFVGVADGLLYVGISLSIILIIIPRKNVRNFNAVVVLISIIPIWLLTYIMIFITKLSFGELKHFYGTSYTIFVYSIYIVLALITIVAYYYVIRNIIKNKNPIEIFTKNRLQKKKIFGGLIILVIAAILVNSFLIYNMFPHINKYSSEVKSYYISDIDSYTYNFYRNDPTHTIYQKIIISTEIKNTRIYYPINHTGVIAIKYSPYEFNETSTSILLTNSIENKTYSLKKTDIESNLEQNQYLEYKGGIGYAFNYDSKEVLILTTGNNLAGFDNITVIGYSPINITKQEFNFRDNNPDSYDEVCNNSVCVFKFNISNNLDKLIYIDGAEGLFSVYQYKNFMNISNCRFLKREMTFNTDKFELETYHTCSETTCYSPIKYKYADKYLSALQFNIYESNINMMDFKISEPISFQAKLYVNCSD